MTMDTPNFVHDLVRMAQAVEELPKVQRELRDAQHTIQHRNDTVEALNQQIANLIRANESIKAELAAAQEERDNASFRHLATQEALDALQDATGTAFHKLGETLKALQPKKEPAPQALNMTMDQAGGEYKVDADGNTTITPFPVEGQSDPVPTAPTTGDGSIGVLYGTADASGGAFSEAVASLSEAVGQSDSNPTGGSSGAGTGSTSDEYSGRIYYDMPKYINEHDWLAGGGSYEAYHWRPHFGARPAA
jgi:hypothetical protein